MHKDLELASIERALRLILVQLSVHLAEYRLYVLGHGEFEHVYDGHLDTVAVYSVLPDRQLFKDLRQAIVQVLIEQLLHGIANLTTAHLLALVAGKLF